MSIPATGRIDRGEMGHDIVIERTFRAPIGDVWRSIVEPERMNRWVGTWSREAGPGKRVMFTMTADEGAQPEEVLIHRCDAPRLLDVEASTNEEVWRMRVELSEAAGVTTLIFRQAVDLDEDFFSYGVGWEYFLDRLVALHDGTPFAGWDDYYPAQLDHWHEQRKQVRTGA